jgi:tRNA(Ile)-lysidine synthase
LEIGFDHIEAVRTKHREMRGLAIPGIELTFHKGYIFPLDFFVPDYSYHVAGPGVLEIEEIRKKLVIKEAGTYKKPKDNFTVIIPAQRAVFPLTVRNPAKGDKYVKINTSIRQKVFEMIRAAGIPSELRNLCPVVLNGDGQIIWVMGSPVAESFKVDHKYLNYLKIG